VGVREQAGVSSARTRARAGPPSGADKLDGGTHLVVSAVKCLPLSASSLMATIDVIDERSAN